MKTLVGILFCLLALTGCASQDYNQYAKAQTDIAIAKHNADAEKYRAMSEIAKAGDSTAKVAAVMAMAMGTGNSTQPSIQPPKVSEALQWASILVPGLTQVVGMRYNYMGQKTSSDNATALGISTNNAFVSMAGRIQAPGSVSTMTLSGTGTIGSGLYSVADRHDTISIDRNDTTLSGTGNLGAGTYTTTDRNDVTNPLLPLPIIPTPSVTAP